MAVTTTSTVATRRRPGPRGDSSPAATTTTAMAGEPTTVTGIPVVDRRVAAGRLLIQGAGLLAITASACENSSSHQGRIRRPRSRGGRLDRGGHRVPSRGGHEHTRWSSQSIPSTTTPTTVPIDGAAVLAAAVGALSTTYHFRDRDHDRQRHGAAGRWRPGRRRHPLALTADAGLVSTSSLPRGSWACRPVANGSSSTSARIALRTRFAALARWSRRWRSPQRIATTLTVTVPAASAVVGLRQRRRRGRLVRGGRRSAAAPAVRVRGRRPTGRGDRQGFAPVSGSPVITDLTDTQVDGRRFPGRPRGSLAHHGRLTEHVPPRRTDQRCRCAWAGSAGSPRRGVAPLAQRLDAGGLGWVLAASNTWRWFCPTTGSAYCSRRAAPSRAHPRRVAGRAAQTPRRGDRGVLPAPCDVRHR